MELFRVTVVEEHQELRKGGAPELPQKVELRRSLQGTRQAVKGICQSVSGIMCFEHALA